MEKHVSLGSHGFSIELPAECPICNRLADITVIKAHGLPKDAGVEVIFQCPAEDCKCYFLGYYGLPPAKELKSLIPKKERPISWPDEIPKISPQFVQIYKEAETARSAGLDQICGPGFRKAAEFLIKDYAKQLAPTEADAIEKKFAGAVVKDYISNPKIQALAERVLWLGNDETHYLRKWVNHDVEDLIKLIKLTTAYIELERLSAAYTADLSSGGAKAAAATARAPATP